ncbi:hypothetical protein [Algoriphagus boritolerans]|uniref:hypothetical protein n=1 Tax=Algoriphagus boritolerans TaxID=308111 RepID=UPI003A101EF3
MQEVWKLSDWIHGLAIASALYGTVIGALFGGIPADRFGRKKKPALDRFILFYFCCRFRVGLGCRILYFFSGFWEVWA